MRSKIFKISAAFVMIAVLSGFATGATAAGDPHISQANGIATITTVQGTISVTGGDNVPFYHIQANGSNTTYLVKFVNMQEFVDKNNDSLFQQNEVVPNSSTTFPGIGWIFSGFKTTNSTANSIQQVNFNFIHDVAPMLALTNYVNVTAGNQINFNIALSQYNWKSTNSTAKLAIEMQISGGKLQKGNSTNDLTFGNAYFNTVSNAQTSSGNITVTTQIANSNTFYLLFDHFNGNFTLDPLFGVNSIPASGINTSTSITGTTTINNPTTGTISTTKTTSLGILPILGGLAVIGLVTAKKKIKH